MSKRIPWDVIGTERENRDDALPDGPVQVKVEAVKESEDGAKFHFLVRSRVTGPVAHRGKSVFDRFYVGTNADPGANDVKTWAGSYGAVRLKDFASCFGIEPDEDAEVFGAQIRDREYIAVIENRTDDGVRKNPDGTTRVDKDAVGKQRTDVKGYYKLGAKPLTLEASAKPAVGAAVAPGFVVEELE